MNGWVIYNGHLPGEKFLDFSNMIKKAGNNQQIKIEVVKNNNLLAALSSSGYHLMKKAPLPEPQFIIFLDKDITLAKQLEMIGIPVFNSSQTIETCDNKITTYQCLATEGLPIPKTIIAPKVFGPVHDIDTESFLLAEQEFNYPFVMKEAYGSFGEQVYLIQNRQEFLAKVKGIMGKPFVIQEFIENSYGRDVRLNVVGNKVVASIIRTNSSDFRANINRGGSATKYQPTKQEEEIAIAAAKAVGADFAGVDLLFGENDQPIICEINSNAHIRGTLEKTGINVADCIIRYIKAKLS